MIFKLLDTEPRIPHQGVEIPVQCRGDIAFEEISFAYPARSDVLVLKDFTFIVQPNQTVALV